MVIGFFTLLHVLILVYWLGGDLGAFYASYFLVDPQRSVPERMLALKILNFVDMAPGSALVLALPTGLTLAAVKSWLHPGLAVLLAIWIVSLLWLALIWALHRRPGAEMLSRIDGVIRWFVLGALLLASGLGLGKAIALPLFIELKMLVLACAIGLGLIVRRQLAPLGGAVRAMISDGPTPASDATIASLMAHARIAVLGLWALVLVAAWLGITTPL